MKNLLWLIPTILILLLAVILIAVYRDPSIDIAVLQEYDICIGDTPREVDSALPGDCTGKEEFSPAKQTICTYETEILNMPAQMRGYFLKNRSLVRVDIVIPCQGSEQAKALFEQAREMIQAFYKDEETFVCGDIVYQNEDNYSLSLGPDDGAACTNYSLEVKGEQLYIICQDLR